MDIIKQVGIKFRKILFDQPLRWSLESTLYHSDPSGLFTLGESAQRDDGVVTTVIKTRHEIDREQIGSNYEFTVEVSHVVFMVHL